MDSSLKGNPPSGNLQPDIHAAIIITLTLAVSAVSLRFVARRLAHASLWLDDWLALFALVTTIGFDINTIFSVKAGVGLHIETINRHPVKTYHDFFLTLWIGELLYTVALNPAKLAFLAFYWRIFQVTSIKLPIKITAVAIALWASVRVLVVVFQCFPLRGYWDKSILATCNVDVQKFFVGSVMPHLLMDLVILALPVPYIKKLQISLRQKLALFCMFLFGGFICFATVIQIVTCFRLDVTSQDVTWNFASMVLWATVEVNLAVMAACLPSLGPIYRLVIHGSLKTIRSSQQGDYTISRNGASNLQTRNMFHNNYSDSTKELAAIEGDGNRSFGEALADSSSGGADTICELGNITLTHTHKAKDVTMVKNDVDIKISARNRSTHT